MSADTAGVPSSRFDPIDDPSDPAWIGHAVAPDPRRRWLAVAVAVLAAGVIGMALASWLFGASSPRAAADAAAPRNAQASSQLQAAAPAAAVVVPPLPRTKDAEARAGTESPPLKSKSKANVAPASSGWAPREATVSAQQAGSGLIKGDTAGVAPVLVQRLDQLAVQLDKPITVISGWRRRHEQEALYRKYLDGTGNLAAVPGSSMHEVGYAADVYVAGVALELVPGAADGASLLGMHFPVIGEPWHVELVETTDLK